MENSMEYLTKELEYLQHLRDEKRRHEEIISQINKRIEEIEKFVSMKMAEWNINSIQHNGYTFYIRKQCFPRIVDREKFFEFLKERGDESIISMTVHHQTLRRWYNQLQLLEENTEVPGLEIFEKIGIGIRKS
ncbi:MAG: gp33 family protein [Candidatus Helarchaeota archaeon]